MRCANCSGTYVKKQGNLHFGDKVLGDFNVPNTEYFKCDECWEMYYTPKTMQDIEKAEALRLKDLLLNRSLKDFIPATEVAKILVCSRQAIHKNKRISRGFIHFVKHNGTFHYLKESVELYKLTQDGRLQLAEPKRKIRSIDFNNHLSQKKTRIPDARNAELISADEGSPTESYSELREMEG